MILTALFAMAFIILLNALPLAFFGMLFLGTIGIHFSFTTCLLGALALKFAHHSVVTPPNKI